jgi:hypothetical protein
VTQPPRATAAPACLALLAGLCLAPAPTQAAERNLQEETDRALAALRALRPEVPAPALTGLSPAREVKLQLPGGKDYATAYRSKEGCVIFFSPLEKGEHDLGFKWDGQRCDGQPVRGQGALTVSYTFDAPSETVRRVFVFRGSFQNGMLSGRKGEKTNFTFEASGKPKASVYALSGEFADGLLHGHGTKTWIGPASREPSTQVEEGEFSEGIPHGQVTFTQLRPYPGVEAETKLLVFDTNGRPFLEQPTSSGKIFFAGDSIYWRTSVKTLKSDWSDASALFVRNSIARPDETSVISWCLTAWEFRPDGLSCAEGLLDWRAPGSAHHLYLSDKKPFRIPMPVRTSGSPLRVTDGEKFNLGGEAGEDDELACSADLSSCRGKSTLWIGTRSYFAGKVEYDQGEVRPVSGLFLQTREPKKRTKQDERWAWCRDFRTPTQCRAGWVVRGPGSWTGPYRFQGIGFDAQAGYQPSSVEFRAIIEGHGRFLWTEGQNYADLVAEDDHYVSVGECDMPLESGAFTCRLDGGMVEFRKR